MLNKLLAAMERYVADMMEENSHNLQQYEVAPGIYSNVNPAKLVNVGSPHCDLLLG